jgi:peptide deformylase
MSDTLPPRLQLVPPDSPILRTPCRQVRHDEFAELCDPKFLYRIDKLRKQLKGVAIAAPQLGDSRSWFLWEYGIVINPQVLFRIHETEEKYEGCLSFPDRPPTLVTRPVEIEVSYTDGLQLPVTRRLHYLNARIFLHEFDHLQGHCIYGS